MQKRSMFLSLCEVQFLLSSLTANAVYIIEYTWRKVQ